METIKFELTKEQAEGICKYLGKNLKELEDWEICELLDEFIDEVLFENDIY